MRRNIMAYLLLSDTLTRQALGREHVFRECADILAETDKWLLSRFRLPALSVFWQRELSKGK